MGRSGNHGGRHPPLPHEMRLNAVMKPLLSKYGEQMLAGAVQPSSKIKRLPASAADSRNGRDTAILTEALSTVFRLQHGPLLRFLSRRAGSREEAEDIIQDAYVRILAVDRTEDIRELERYVWRSALNIATDHGRARQRWNRIAKALSAQEEHVTPSAEVSANARERWTLLIQAVSELPPRDHQAFMLRVAQSLPFEDVGRAMQVSSRMAKIYVARALVYLQRRLEGADVQSGVKTRSRSRAQRDTTTSAFRADQNTEGPARSQGRRLVLRRPPDAASG